MARLHRNRLSLRIGPAGMTGIFTSVTRRGFAIAVTAAVFVFGCVSLPKEVHDSEEVPVRFIFKDTQAKTVCIAGNFNEWSVPGSCMTRIGEVWELVIPLPKGRHEYVFVVDGTWQPDPGASLSEDTGFGFKNSILLIE